jgi:hypothetical protein
MRQLRVASLFVLLGPGVIGAQSACTAIGKAQWTVKTESPLAPSKAVPIAPDVFSALPVPAEIASHEKGAKNSETRYPDKLEGQFREGEVVSLTGWVRFIKLSSDDCDFHIQVTPDSAGTDGMIIVEIPQADAEHVTNGALRAELEIARAAMESDLKLNKEPSKRGNKIGSAYMTFDGALYFDAPHWPHCELRGVGMPASTCWEIHPVTKVSFAKKP